MICSVSDCGRPTRSPTAVLCNTHYFRVYRTGSVGTAPVAVKGLPRPCPVPGCTRERDLHGYCLFHARRIEKGGSPDYVPSFRGPRNPAWKDDGQIGYVAAHERVTAAHGSARKYLCQHCGGSARHWAYQHTDPNELKTPDGIPYSNDPVHYRPLCVPCHKRFDLDRGHS